MPPEDAAATPRLCFGNRKKPGGLGVVQAGARGSDSSLSSGVSLPPAAPQSSRREAGSGGCAHSTEVTTCGVWLGACHTVCPWEVTTGPYLCPIHVPGTALWGAGAGSPAAWRPRSSERSEAPLGAPHGGAGCVTSAGPLTSLSSTLLLGGIKASSRGVVHGAGSPPRSPAPACRQPQPRFPPGEQGFGEPNTALVTRAPGGLPARQGAPSAEERLLERPTERAAPRAAAAATRRPARPAGGRMCPRAARVLASPRRLQPARLIKGPRGAFLRRSRAALPWGVFPFNAPPDNSH